MRQWLLFLFLFLAAPAQAGPGHAANAVVTLAGAFAGCAGGGLLGMGVYGVIDPYKSDDGLEWLVIGTPAGCGIGGPIGATVLHTVTGGSNGGRVLLVSGLIGLAGSAMVVATPALYENFADERFAVSYVSGFAFVVAISPLSAFMTALFSKGRAKKAAPVVYMLPLVEKERMGVGLVGRF